MEIDIEIEKFEKTLKNIPSGKVIRLLDRDWTGEELLAELKKENEEHSLPLYQEIIAMCSLANMRKKTP